MKEIKVSKREEGGTLLKLLRKYLREAPDSFFYKMLRKENITLNGKRAGGKEKLAEGDSIRLFFRDETIRNFGGAAFFELSEYREEGRREGAIAKIEELEKKGKFSANAKNQPEILYEDEDLLFLNKPVGWLVQKASREDFSLNEWMLSYLLRTGKITPKELLIFRPGICNRLDRNTSGIVAAGKTLAGLQFLSGAFNARTLHKYYTCIAVGEITQPARLEGYLKKDAKENRVQVFSVLQEGEEGSFVRTAYRPIEIKNGCTYLEVELFTGKTHQIRAHLAGNGHSILGDIKYSDAAGLALSRQYRVKSQLLHAKRLIFSKDQDQMGKFSYMSEREITAKEPETFQKVKERLGFIAKEEDFHFNKCE
jgi:23S rRNA pseudouridine955/2504/2580 synthase